nr:acyltransferase [uncultured Lichenicoccus sp.]
MTWFRGLEGARAWLAWAVVAEHIVGLTALATHHPAAIHLLRAGDAAVGVFIVISGFVITHLIVEKREPYPVYLARRFLRIYPVYLACLALGLVSTLLLGHVMARKPWGGAIPYTPIMAHAHASLAGRGLLLHLAAHLTLLHGMIPDSRLFQAQLALLTPAWSLSLEWQFYLVAPLLVWALRRQDTTLLATGLALAGYLATRKGLCGSFLMPSLLPASTLPFALGIATRLALPGMARRRTFPLPVVVLLAVGLHCVAPGQTYVAIWALLVLYMTTDQTMTTQGDDAVGRMSMRVLHGALDSDAARWLGRRSYCVYLLHFPVLQLLLCVAGAWLHLGYRPTLVLLSALAPPLVLAGADLLHRHVELPGIALGRRGMDRGPAAGRVAAASGVLPFSRRSGSPARTAPAG